MHGVLMKEKALPCIVLLSLASIFVLSYLVDTNNAPHIPAQSTPTITDRLFLLKLKCERHPEKLSDIYLKYCVEVKNINFVDSNNCFVFACVLFP